MSKLADTLAKIRLDHAVNPLSPPESTITPSAVPDDDPEERRRLQCTYAAFPAPLKAAMKLAAQRNGWCRATWLLQTALIQDALLAGLVLESEIVAGYSAKPPEMALEATVRGDPLPWHTPTILNA